MAGGEAWTDAEVRLIAGRKVDGVGVQDIYSEFCERFGTSRTFHAVHNAFYKRHDVARMAALIKRGEVDAPSVVPAFVDEEHHDPERLWERAKAETTSAIEYHEKRHHADVTFNAELPVALSFISDQHISEGGTVNLERMEADASLIAGTPGLWGVLGGDGVDNHIKHQAAMIASGSKPGNEWRLYDHYIGFFQDKLCAMISGNHDDWTKDMTDTDNVGAIARRNRIFYAPDYVVLQVHVGLQSYAVKIRHQYRFSSSLNETHSVKRMWSEDSDDFDVGVVCHKHRSALEPFEKHGLERWACRPGSYQYSSGFSRRFGYTVSLPTCPTVVLLPTTRQMIGFKDVRPAASYLTWLRDGWPDTGEVFDI
jgi:hypothetical protein